MTTVSNSQALNIDPILAKLREAQAPKRAALFSLVVYTTSSLSSYSQAIVKDITSQFPCRLIYIQHVEDPSQEGINVELLSEGTDKISSQELHVKCTSDHLFKLPFLLFPLLLRDLPLYLLWEPDPTTDQQVLPSILPYASRLIFDADVATDLSIFEQRICKMKASHPACEFIDINWTLLTGWRHILRQVFDSPTKSEQLRKNEGITIDYNARKIPSIHHQETEAIYLLGWLATVFNWTIQPLPQKKESVHEFVCKTENRTFTATFRPQSYPKLYPGTVLGINIVGNGDRIFDIAPFPQAPKVVVHISSQETCDLPFTLPLPTLKPGFPYVKELFFSTMSDQYEAVLKTIGMRK